ncbi:hypothetical protein ACFXD5_31860 [Streptomyces sp. NPDC059385]|uniref:hypothetical protein n=1 Tax=Streptomyces sp. NPDC059385 TaxID=3346817 RepID=UPI0036AA2AAB
MLAFTARNRFLRPLCTAVGLVLALTLAVSQPDHRTLWTVSAVLGGLDLAFQGLTALLGRKKSPAGGAA